MTGKDLRKAAAISLLSVSLANAQEQFDQSEITFPGFDILRLDLFQSAGMDFDGTSGELEVSRLNIRSLLSKPIVPFEDLTILPFLSYNLTSLNFDGTPVGFPIQDEDLHSVSVMAIGIKTFKNSNWFAAGFSRVELASDFQGIRGDSITYDIGAGVGYRFSDSFTLGFGVVATDLNGEESIFPGINFDWKVCEKFRVGLYGPTFQASYEVNECWKLSILGQNGGGSWNISDNFGQSRTIDLDSYNIGLYTENKVTGSLWLRAGVGVTFANEIEIRDNNAGSSFSRDLDGSLFAQIGLSLTEW
ncbi:MAG: DUF6268 family outer membrane beta-barrel protein [Luteolibacter sp.]